VILLCEQGCEVHGEVVHEGIEKHALQQVLVQPDNQGTTEAILFTTSLYPKYHRGDIVTVRGKIVEPPIFFPHEGEGKGFDYGSYLRTKEVGSISYYPHIEKVDERKTVTTHLTKFREELINRLTFFMEQPASQLASGMIFGTNSLSDTILEEFRMAGLSHVIVLSGFNIVVLISLLLFLVRFLPLVLRVTIVSAGVVVFIIMVEGEVSVIRAAIMAGISLLALVYGRTYEARQALVVSLVAIVAYNPYSLLHDVSLHLSFLATAGIVYALPTTQFYLQKIKILKQVEYIQEAIATSLVAYVSTLPYVLYMFGSVSLYALFVNILVVPIVPLAMFLGVATVIISFVTFHVATVFGIAATIVSSYIIFMAHSVSLLPFARISTEISFISMLLLYGGGVCSTYFASRYVKYLEKNLEIQKIIDHETLRNTSAQESNRITDIISY
jgi:competence protein ComEC